MERLRGRDIYRMVCSEAIKNKQLEHINMNWKAKFKNIPTPRDDTHGRRHLGKLDITDFPTNLNINKVMPLPYFCWKCGNGMLLYWHECTRCGAITPLGEWLKNYGRR